MKTLADLDYDELQVRAAEAARLPALDGDDEDFAGLDVLDNEVRSGYGQVAVTSDAWLRERANVVLRGLPDPPRPVDALRRLDDETLELVLFTAVYEICLEHRHLRAFDPGKHKRWPKGHPLAGKFRPMVDLLKEAIARFDPKTDRNPFDLFKRPQLLKAARDLGIKLDRGEGEDSIAAKLVAHLDPKAKKPAAAAVPVKKAAAPAKKATPAGAKKTAKVAGPDDGLDAIDELDLKDLAIEFDLDPKRPRDELIDALRAQGVVSPVVKLKRNQEFNGLLDRLKNMGRRRPADDGPLDRASIELADGADAKTVAKQLRKEADSVGRKEDADTLRFLASDLTSKKAKPPPYINAKGRIDLVKLAEANGVDLRKWMPLDQPPQFGHAMMDYRDENFFDPHFRRFWENLGNPRGPMSRAKAIRLARETAADIRLDHANASTGIGLWSWSTRVKDRKQMVDRGLDAAADLERLADLAEAAKVPAVKRAVTLGGTTLGEIVPVDETRFQTRKLKSVLKHRGELTPDSFVHKGFGAALMRQTNRPKRPGLTDTENEALDLYTVSAVADGLNGSLRKGRNVHGEVKLGNRTVDLDQVSRDLDSALADSQLTADTVLWRGAVPAKADYRRLVPGAIYSDAGYLSTATSEKGARYVIDWRKGIAPPGRQPVLFKILAPAGSRAGIGHEAVDEALLPRGQEMRVVRVDESGDVPVVVVELLAEKVDPGVVKGRSIVDDFDYDGAVQSGRGYNGIGGGDRWLGAVQKAQGFNGKPKVVTRQEMDEAVRGGATEVFRAVRGRGDKTSADLTEEYRTGELFPGNGVYGAGTYTSPQRETAKRYGDEKTMLRIALRRDARVVSYADLLKLRPRTGITASATKLADQRQAELDKVDPTDTKAIQAIIDKYAALASKQGSRSQIAGDLGRIAALLGYDAIYIPGDYVGKGSKRDGQTEYVILNRTATMVEEATP